MFLGGTLRCLMSLYRLFFPLNEKGLDFPLYDLVYYGVCICMFVCSRRKCVLRFAGTFFCNKCLTTLLFHQCLFFSLSFKDKGGWVPFVCFTVLSLHLFFSVWMKKVSNFFSRVSWMLDSVRDFSFHTDSVFVASLDIFYYLFLSACTVSVLNLENPASHYYIFFYI